MKFIIQPGAIAEVVTAVLDHLIKFTDATYTRDEYPKATVNLTIHIGKFGFVVDDPEFGSEDFEIDARGQARPNESETCVLCGDPFDYCPGHGEK